MILPSGRHQNVVIRGVPEPFIKNSKARSRDMKHYVLNYPRLVDLSDQVGIKRTLRLGKWRNFAEKSLPRLVLVAFSNPRQRDCFLAFALKLREATNGQVIVKPDDKSLKLQSKASATFIASPTNMVDVELAIPQILESQTFKPSMEGFFPKSLRNISSQLFSEVTTTGTYYSLYIP